MRILRIIIIFTLIFIAYTTIALSQQPKLEKPVECKSNLKIRGKFKTKFVGSSGGPSFQVEIIVDIKHQTDENYLAIAKQLKAKYCKEEKMYVVMFDNKEHYKLGVIPQPERPIEGYPRALYVLDRATKEDFIEIYKIVNGRIETRQLNIEH